MSRARRMRSNAYQRGMLEAIWDASNNCVTTTCPYGEQVDDATIDYWLGYHREMADLMDIVELT